VDLLAIFRRASLLANGSDARGVAARAGSPSHIRRVKGDAVTLTHRIGRLASIAVAGLFVGFAAIGNASAAGPGPETCKNCHENQVASYENSVHGQKGNAHGPANTGQCEACHGEGTEHVKQNGGYGVGGMMTPGSKRMAAAAASEVCLKCHTRDSNRSHWPGSAHDARDITCANCHSMHTPDRVLAKITQAEVCFRCHQQQRAEVNRPYRHPIQEGKVVCSDCHNTHGSVGPKLVRRDSTVDTCYQCHAEKRGPFVHNHEPVQEDCGYCHNPHGTVVESMLKMRMPFLCHNCHTPHGGQIAQLMGQRQPAALLGPNTGGKSGINYTQARGCTNCHTQVHGGNNPSATNPTPQFMLR
jgi:DmsE family decaheme c-type cytochrome